jgi:vacuolar protein sorting-associated protein 11
MQSKLNMLYTNYYFQLAMSLATQPALAIHNTNNAENATSFEDNEQVSKEAKALIVVETCTKYGDYLYSKGDYDASMKQYILTIGNLEPSYVIRKFLDAQRINNLTLYLQELHKKELANTNHTTLLLNCYTKLDDISRLDSFIDSDASFDIKTALRGFIMLTQFVAKPSFTIRHFGWLKSTTSMTGTLKYRWKI